MPLLHGHHPSPRRPPAGGALANEFHAFACKDSYTNVTTNPLGEFAYRVPLGPSLTVAFSYRAFANDAAPAAAARAHRSVLTRIRREISPRGTFNAGTITRNRQVEGGPYRTDGVTPLVEVREDRRWQPVDEIISLNARVHLELEVPAQHQGHLLPLPAGAPATGAGAYPCHPPGASRAITVAPQVSEPQ